MKLGAMTKRKRLVILSLVVLLVIAGTQAWHWWTRKPEGILLASGTIEATEVAVSFKIPGRVIERSVDEGDRLAPGALVGRLESRELEAEVDRLSASLQATETRLPQLKTEISLQEELTRGRIADAQATLAVREERLAELRNGSRPQDLQKAWAEVREAKAVMENAQVDSGRMDSLFRDGGVAEQARDAARTNFTVAVERHRNALERLDLVKEGPRQEEIRRAEAEVRQAKAGLLLAQTGELEILRKRQELATLQATIARDRAALAAAVAQLGYTVLRSPGFGVILRKHVEPGEMIAGGDPGGHHRRSQQHLGEDLHSRASAWPHQAGPDCRDYDGFLPGQGVSGQGDLHQLGGRVYPQERPDPGGAGQIGLRREDRRGQPKPGIEAGDAGRCPNSAGARGEGLGGGREAVMKDWKDDTPAIEIRDLTRTFGSVRAVDHLLLAIPRGELFGLVGPDGAGKTTTLRMLAGILTPTEGDAVVAGHSIRKAPEALKGKIAYMSQRFGLYGDLTVLENLNFYADLFEVPKKERAARIERLLEFGNLTPFKHRLADKLSGGMKQKLGLSCAPIHTPEIVLLDEPTKGVDPVSRRDFWRILYDMLKEGVTILVTTAYLDEAERCNRVGLMHQGRLLALDTPERIKDLMAGDLVEIPVADAWRARHVLATVAQAKSVTLFGRRLHVAMDDMKRDLPAVLSALEGEGLQPQDPRQVIPSLEDVFISMIERGGAHERAA